MADFPFGRIKGANSDYEFSPEAQQIIEVDPKAKVTFLQVFICPYGMPSKVDQVLEPEPPYLGDKGAILSCNGTDTDCPSKGAGHAMLELHQTDGVKLSTGTAELNIGQAGAITLSPKGKTPIVWENRGALSPRGNVLIIFGFPDRHGRMKIGRSKKVLSRR